MNNIAEIQNGERGLSVREKLNSLIRLMNEGIREIEDYEALRNLPSINGIKLKGNISLTDIGVTELIDRKISDNNREYFTAAEVRRLMTETINNLVGLSVDPELVENTAELKRDVEDLKRETYQFAIDVGEEDRYKLIAYDKEQKPSLLCLRDDGAVIEVRTVYESEEKRITVDWNERWKGKIYVR